MLSSSSNSDGRGDRVDDVGRLAEAEIFVTDEAHGRRSRGEDGAFFETKGRSSFGLEVELLRTVAQRVCVIDINGLIPTVS